MNKPEIHMPTKAAPVGEGRRPALDAASASAIAEANAAAGFPSPPIVEAALEPVDASAAKTALPTPTPQTDKPAKPGAAN